VGSGLIEIARKWDGTFSSIHPSPTAIGGCVVKGYEDGTFLPLRIPRFGGRKDGRVRVGVVVRLVTLEKAR
jgi:hypothetical protein